MIHLSLLQPLQEHFWQAACVMTQNPGSTSKLEMLPSPFTHVSSQLCSLQAACAIPDMPKFLMPPCFGHCFLCVFGSYFFHSLTVPTEVPFRMILPMFSYLSERERGCGGKLCWGTPGSVSGAKAAYHVCYPEEISQNTHLIYIPGMYLDCVLTNFLPARQGLIASIQHRLCFTYDAGSELKVRPQKAVQLSYFLVLDSQGRVEKSLSSLYVQAYSCWSFSLSNCAPFVH